MTESPGPLAHALRTAATRLQRDGRGEAVVRVT
jgi:hypothetical protein